MLMRRVTAYISSCYKGTPLWHPHVQASLNLEGLDLDC